VPFGHGAACVLTQFVVQPFVLIERSSKIFCERHGNLI
jgi:hypothetical protein